MRALASVFFLLLTGAAWAPPPASRVVATLAPDAETRWVPFDLTGGGQIHFTALLNGIPVNAILDTGVSYSALSRDYVVRTGIKVQTAGHATAIGGAVPIGLASMPSLSVGALSRAGGSITVATLPQLATGGASADLLIGRDLLAAYALDIDFDTHRFRLLPTGRLPFRGASAPLSVHPELQVYVTWVSVAGRRVGPMIVDTGDGSAVTLSGIAWHALELASPPPSTSAIAYGVGGPIETDLMVLPEMHIGGLAARNIELRIERTGGFSARLGVAGRIGSGLLQRYRVLLDPKAGHMVFARGAVADAEPARSTSGLMVALEGTQLRVLHVMRGGPAAAQGVWKAGDTICSVDSQPITPDYPRQPLAAWSTGTPGRIVQLGLCNGATRSLTLRRFY